MLFWNVAGPENRLVYMEPLKENWMSFSCKYVDIYYTECKKGVHKSESTS